MNPERRLFQENTGTCPIKNCRRYFDRQPRLVKPNCGLSRRFR